MLSRCDTWYRYPDLSGEARQLNGAEWGNGHIRDDTLLLAQPSSPCDWYAK